MTARDDRGNILTFNGQILQLNGIVPIGESEVRVTETLNDSLNTITPFRGSVYSNLHVSLKVAGVHRKMNSLVEVADN